MALAGVIIAALALLASVYALIDSRASARRANAAAERSAVAAEASADTSRRSADVAEHQLAIALQDRAQAPPPWRLERVAGDIVYALHNDSDHRTFAVVATSLDRSGGLDVDWPGGPDIGAHASIRFEAIPGEDVDQRLVVSWKWTRDGPLEEWVTSLPWP